MHSPDAVPVPRIDGSVALPHWGLIRARGADAAKFLHGQLTQDFAALSPQGVQLAGFCSAKGRLQASFFGWKRAHDEVMLACHASVLPATLKRLGMFVMRAQCKLSDASPELACTGLVGDAAVQVLAEAGLADAPLWQHKTVGERSLLRLPNVGGLERAVWVAGPASITGYAAGIAPGIAPGSAPDLDLGAPQTSIRLTLDTWRWLEVLSGVPVVEAATAEQFVPQMLNYELVGGVDFQKGCYPGQEVVARSQYRGTIKRRMFLFDVDAAAAPGQEVFHSADPTQPAGMVVNAAPRPQGGGHSLLAEVKLAMLDDGSLHLGTADGPPLTRLALPYPVPLAAEKPNEA